MGLSLAGTQNAAAAPTYVQAALTLSGGTLADIDGIAIDGGTLYILDGATGVDARVLVANSSGTVSAVLTLTGVSNPQGIAVGGGDLFIADTPHHRVVKTLLPTATATVTPTLVAGSSSSGGAPVPGTATSSPLKLPSGLAYDGSSSPGSLYIADTGNNQVEKVTSSTLSVVAGTGSSTAGAQTPGVATASRLSAPKGVAVDASGDLYIADTGNNAIAKVSGSTLSTLATVPTPTALAVDPGAVIASSGATTGTVIDVVSIPVSGGAPTKLNTSSLVAVTGVAVGGDGTVWAADANGASSRVVTMTPAIAPEAPLITSAAPTKAAKDGVFRHAFTASGWPRPAWTYTGTLPVGLTMNAAGVLSGTPTTPGSSTFTVRASSGSQHDDQVVTLVVGSAPAAIAAAPTVVVGQGSAAVTWAAATPPTGDAATQQREAVTGYVVTPYAGTTAGTAKTIAAGTLTATVSGLKAGTAYTFTVAATNAFGTGTPSAASAAVTPYGGIKEPPAGLTRYEGGTRVATAVKVSQQLFPDTGSARAVVVASSTSFADSLAGARLASAVGGPLLLTDPLALNSEVAAEVGRVLAVPTATTTTTTPTTGAAAAKATTTGTVYLLGGTSAVSGEVETAVKAVNTKYVVTRISGTDRFETATKIAAQVTVDDPVAGAPVYVASGTNYPDGLAVAALAARTGGVVLLTDGATMPASTYKYLETRDPNSELLVAVGGPAAAATSGHGAERAIVGSDRYDTARKVAARFTAAPGSKAVRSVGLATGQNWPDALAGAAAMGNLGGPLLLTPDGALSPSVSTAVTSLSSAGKPSSALVFGGSSVVSTSASDAFAALVK